jgi:hypothetical protein
MGHVAQIHQLGGIKISMYPYDHNPPHFHALYAEYEAQVCLDPLEVLEGELPRRQLAEVLEWAGEHLDELAADWAQGQEGEQPSQI